MKSVFLQVLDQVPPPGPPAPGPPVGQRMVKTNHGKPQSAQDMDSAWVFEVYATCPPHTFGTEEWEDQQAMFLANWTQDSILNTSIDSTGDINYLHQGFFTKCLFDREREREYDAPCYWDMFLDYPQ